MEIIVLHSPIVLREVGLTFADHICFEKFSAELHPGDRVGLIGPNGSGKSSLLKLLAGAQIAGPPGSDNADSSDSANDSEAHVDGAIHRPSHLRVARLRQFPTPEIQRQSGGEIFQSEFSRLLREDPDLLLLDEPGNHLDARNRSLLLRRLRDFAGILVVVSHEPELLRALCAKLWVFEASPGFSAAEVRARYRLRIFHGDYDAYSRERESERQTHAAEFTELRSRERSLKIEQQREARRAASSRRANRNENDRSLLGSMQERGGRTRGKHGRRQADARARLDQDRAAHRERGSAARQARFRFQESRELRAGGTTATVRDGAAGYDATRPLFEALSFSLRAGEGLGIRGENGAGKSTLLAALRSDPAVHRQGEWQLPAAAPYDRRYGRAGQSRARYARNIRNDRVNKDERVAWIDQFFGQLRPEFTVLDEIQSARPDWDHAAIRRHLNDALFSTNAEVARRVAELSGGERARLSFARIAARPPALLLLDEINNHLDLVTRETIIAALRDYLQAGGALVIVSHDADFLKAIGLTNELRVVRRGPLRDSGED